jgi:hypothetical protein
MVAPDAAQKPVGVQKIVLEIDHQKCAAAKIHSFSLPSVRSSTRLQRSSTDGTSMTL